MLLIQLGKKKPFDLMPDPKSVQVVDEVKADRFSKYNTNQNFVDISEEKQHILLDLFREDACIKDLLALSFFLIRAKHSFK